MRKFLRMMVLAAAMLFAGQANAQFDFGLKGGLNVTNMSFSKEVFDASNKAGFFVGPTVKVSLPLTGVGLDLSALYDQKSAKVSDELGEQQTVKQQNISIPLNVRYGIGLGSMASVFVFAGPQWGINIGDKNFNWKSGSSYSLKKSNFSVNVGLGLMAFSDLQFSFNYNIACGKTAEATFTKAVTEATTDKSHNNSWQIALAYFF